MWKRLFAALLAVSIVVTAFFIFYAASWLKSIGSPRDAFDGFFYYARLSQFAMWASFLALLVVGNVVLWLDRKAWALWTTLLFAVVFLFVRLFWLETAGLNFAERNALDGNRLRWGFVLAILTSAATAGVIYFDVFLVSRLREKMYPPSPEPTEAESEAASDLEAAENEKDLAE